MQRQHQTDANAGSTRFLYDRKDDRLRIAQRSAVFLLPLPAGQGHTSSTGCDHAWHRAEQHRISRRFRRFRRGARLRDPGAFVPGRIGDPEDLHNFKFIQYQDIRFDQVLLDIVDEVGERFNLDTDRFCLHGFSGGGQFTHRFLYLHPDRLAAASIGAPGR